MEESKEGYLDIQETKRITDKQAIEIIKNICKVNHCLDFQKINPDERDTHIKTLKSIGLSTRQIARLTGISRKVILKA